MGGKRFYLLPPSVQAVFSSERVKPRPAACVLHVETRRGTMADDPFSQTLEKLWELLESHEGFCRLVRLGNRRKTAAAHDSVKGRLLPADLPEVRIEPAGGQADLLATSTSSQAVQDYLISAACGTGAPESLLLPLKWELMKALSRAGAGLGLDFVRKVRVGEPAARPQDKPDATAGWTVRLTVSVEMWFSTSQLQA